MLVKIVKISGLFNFVSYSLGMEDKTTFASFNSHILYQQL